MRRGEGRNLSPVERGKRDTKRSTVVDARGIPLGTITAPANRHDSPLLVPTLEHASASVGGLPEGTSVHLDRGYDSDLTCERLEERGLLAEIVRGTVHHAARGHLWRMFHLRFQPVG
jgi:IS5 family transposase